MDVIQERLEREFGFDLIATAPSVIFHVFTTSGDMITVDNPSKMPAPTTVDYIQEPFVEARIMVPSEYVGTVMDLCQKKRGNYVDMQAMDDSRMSLVRLWFVFFR